MSSYRPDVVRSPRDAAALGTVLGIWAHPDDETYLSAGLMAWAADAGNRVVCITATRGELGTDDPLGWPPRRLAALRGRELAAALAALGPIESGALGHGDGRCHEVPWSVGVSQVMALLDEVQPDTVVTFGPDGMTGHADHRAVSAWVTDGWRLSGGAGRLLHATTTSAWAETHRELHDALGVFGEDGPPVTGDADLGLVVELDDQLLDRKLVALRAHASQTRTIEGRISADRLRSWWAEECFRAADTAAGGHDDACKGDSPPTTTRPTPRRSDARR